MMKFLIKLTVVQTSLVAFFSLCLISTASAQSKTNRNPKVGREAAQKYFQKEAPAPSKEVAGESASYSGSSLLMLHVGNYTQSTSYQWKSSGKRDSIAKSTYGFTYLYDQWSGFDLNLRGDFNEFLLDDFRATKLSFLVLLTFPRTETRFPIYFGIGAGPGIFFSQSEGESNLSLDYQLVTGIRFLDLYENLGAFVEFGLKNHLHLLSDGQLNATAISGGIAFTF